MIHICQKEAKSEPPFRPCNKIIAGTCTLLSDLYVTDVLMLSNTRIKIKVVGVLEIMTGNNNQY